MAYRQYIGARYVPLYVGDWDSTRNYEPLSIVTDGNGNSYTSLKDVPAGTQLNNRDYWILTSSFSGAVEQLRRDVNDLQQSDVEMNNQITQLSDKAKRRKFILIGDSYSSGILGDGTTSPNGGWVKRLIAANGFTENVDVFTGSGSGLTGNAQFSPTGSNATFAALLTHAITKIPANAIDEVTDIVVYGGSNDIGKDDIHVGISNFMNVVKTTWQGKKRPNVRVGILMGTHTRTRENITARVRVIRAYMACSQYGAQYVTNSEFIAADYSLIGDDGTHPTEDGYVEISKYMNAAHIATSYDVYRTEYKQTGFIDFTSGDVNANERAANVYMHNNMIEFMLALTGSYIDYTLKNPISMGNSGVITFSIGKIRSNLFNGNGIAGAYSVPCHGLFHADVDGGSWHSTTGVLQFFDDGEVRFTGFLIATAPVSGTKNITRASLNIVRPTFESMLFMY